MNRVGGNKAMTATARAHHETTNPMYRRGWGTSSNMVGMTCPLIKLGLTYLPKSGGRSSSRLGSDGPV